MREEKEERLRDRLSRYWRVVATAFCFAVFGMGGLVVRCVVYPLLMLSVRNPQRRMALSQDVIHHSFRLFVALMAAVGVLTYELRGREKLKRRGMLVLANHPSLIDVVFLISFVRHANCIVKEKLVRNPFTSGPIRAAGFITNDGGAQLLDDCIATLASGNNLVIFPEGTRTPLDGQEVRLQRGAANIAIRGRVDVTPVHIHSSLPMLPKEIPWWQVPARRPHFTISVGDDIDVSQFCTMASDALAARHLTDHLSQSLFMEPPRAVA